MLTLSDRQVKDLEISIQTIRIEAGGKNQRWRRIINYADKAQLVIKKAKRKSQLMLKKIDQGSGQEDTDNKL